MPPEDRAIHVGSSSIRVAIRPASRTSSIPV